MEAAYYLDCYLFPIKPANIKEYKKLAAEISRIYIEYGALAVWECVVDRDNNPISKTFNAAAKCFGDEQAVLSWVVYRNKEHRDDVFAKVNEDLRIQNIYRSPIKLFEQNKLVNSPFETLVVR